MKMFSGKVVRKFRDKHTKKVYDIDADYHHEDEKRLNQLEDLGFVEIEEKAKGGDPGDEFPKHTSGGYYELPNGDKVQGKNAALKAMEELKAG
jgi:hypothetical protein